MHSPAHDRGGLSEELKGNGVSCLPRCGEIRLCNRPHPPSQLPLGKGRWRSTTPASAEDPKQLRCLWEGGCPRGWKRHSNSISWHPIHFSTGEKAQADLLETKHQAGGSSGNRTVFSAKLLSLRLPSRLLLTHGLLAHPHLAELQAWCVAPGMEMLLAGPGF